jgi:phosphomevalonate kinase
MPGHRVVAPGKMLLTGSYAVLEGAPALVCAVDRYAVAREPSAVSASAEVAAAFGAEAPRSVDASALSRGRDKLGLGGSAAAVVAALGYRSASRGEDLASAPVRHAILRDARGAHARVQGGGSGVDIAASVYGGVLRYCLEGERPVVAPVALPGDLRFDAYWSGQSARTSEMRARVEALKSRDPRAYVARLRDLTAAAVAAVSAVEAGVAPAFLDAARSSERALSALGRDADAPIVIPRARALVLAAEEEGAAFLPSGAGGGDVFVRFGLTPPSSRFHASARAAGFEKLELSLDALGVRMEHGLGEPSE